MFRVLLEKELLEQWRTRRLAILAAVLLLFGMGSPLMAKLTPRLVGALGGSRDGVTITMPPPEMKDALGQFVKNISQFGALLAILLGMSSVAGEKARGWAVFTLSRPVGRSPFILAKFAAQALVLLGGMVPAAAGCYLYTGILFQAPPAGAFLAISVFLTLFILVFASLALLASALARSTAAAAGLAFAGAVILLLLGYIPYTGSIAPASLVDCSYALASGGNPSWAVPVAGNAAAILLFLLGAVFSFRRMDV